MACAFHSLCPIGSSNSCTPSDGNGRTARAVAYATARADLLQLAEQKWLVQHTRGRRMEFLPGPRLRRARDAL